VDVLQYRSIGSVVVTAAVAAALGVASDGLAPDRTVTAEPAEHIALQQGEYMGSRDGCRKCHLREYRSWERTKHANAIDVLSDEEKQNPECLACHTTGYGQPTGFTTMDATEHLASIGCEACHGPGSLFNEKETMKDHEAALAAGLRIPDEQTCLGCHNSDSPTFPGEFNYGERVEEGVHSLR
jgi:hypothetical protein